MSERMLKPISLHWNQLALEAIKYTQTSPPLAARALAMVHTSMYDAWVDKPGSESIGPDIKDSNLVTDKTQKDNINMALAFMNQRFRLVPFDISETIQGVQEAKDKGKYTKDNQEVFMELVFPSDLR